MDLTTLELESLTKSHNFEIDSYIQEKLDRINQRISDLVPDCKELYHSLIDAACYSLQSCGKRLRPIFLLAALEDLQISWEKGLDPACAIEFIHTYSLIHDDLPCMDDDDLRRGKPSLHKAFDEATALLAGDFLLTYAFETIANCHLDGEAKVELIKILSQRAGGHGMIAGQVLDLSFEGKKIDRNKLLQMHSLKTASLFISCMEMAAVIANVSPSERQSLSTFAAKLGLSFQMMDDVLDITSSSEVLGKPTGSDLIKEKSTSVALYGIEGAKKEAEKFYSSALEDSKDLQHDFPRLKALSLKLFHRSF